MSEMACLVNRRAGPPLATIEEALEMNRTDARDAAGKGYEELSVAL